MTLVLQTYHPIPADRDDRGVGKFASVKVFDSFEDWSRDRKYHYVVLSAIEFDVAFLVLHVKLGGEDSSGVWITLPDGTVVFYCNFWMSGDINSDVCLIDKRDNNVISIDNPLEGNYYLQVPDSNDIEYFYHKR